MWRNRSPGSFEREIRFCSSGGRCWAFEEPLHGGLHHFGDLYFFDVCGNRNLAASPNQSDEELLV